MSMPPSLGRVQLSVGDRLGVGIERMFQAYLACFSLISFDFPLSRLASTETVVFDSQGRGGGGAQVLTF